LLEKARARPVAVEYTGPGLKGAAVSNVTKPAKLETGLAVQVPAFIAEGVGRVGEMQAKGLLY
jgi:hypothetical protein